MGLDIHTPKAVTPELFNLDLDSDGVEGAVVLCYQGGTQVQNYDLHMLKQQPDGSLTDYQFPGALYGELLSGWVPFADGVYTLSDFHLNSLEN